MGLTDMILQEMQGKDQLTPAEFSKVYQYLHGISNSGHQLIYIVDNIQNYITTIPAEETEEAPVEGTVYRMGGEQMELQTPEAHFLVVDDNEMNLFVAKKLLSKTGARVTTCTGGLECLRALTKEKFDLVFLDYMMPDMDGLTALKNLRQKSNIPVMMITARTADAERILGLNIGADDYICKPFNPLEVAARVKAFMRRYYDLGAGNIKEEAEVLKAMDLELDTDKCLLTKGGEIIELTSVEYKMMEMFMKNPGKVFTKQQLYEYAWGDDFFASDNNIMVAISKLRTKLDEDASKYIKTMRGLGYRLEIK
jgi:DNA-binding response OmpR family regulator